ncbi:hypothetical protein RB195_007778 [Necator americanus]|uniref:Uncharacterized protein n=1 Tax=Necator americanus TaxID=51031 RepID=A0ABR1C1K2_NECAM
MKKCISVELDAVYGGAYTSVYQLVEMMRINPKILGQMLYPKTTGYGCHVEGFSKKSKCYLKGACVFDKEAPVDYEMEKKACTKNDDCTYEKPATCLYPLCYAQKK